MYSYLKKLIFLSFLLMATTVHAQTDFGLEFRNQYIGGSSGAVLSEDPVLQAWGGHTIGKIRPGFWGSYDSTGEQKGDEIDYILDLIDIIQGVSFRFALFDIGTLWKYEDQDIWYANASKNISGTDVKLIAYMPKGRAGWEVELGRKIKNFYPGLHFGEFSGSGEKYITPSLTWSVPLFKRVNAGVKISYQAHSSSEKNSEAFFFLRALVF